MLLLRIWEAYAHLTINKDGDGRKTCRHLINSACSYHGFIGSPTA